MRASWTAASHVGPLLLTFFVLAIGLTSSIQLDRASSGVPVSARPVDDGLVMRGTASKLYPGHTVKLPVTVVNRQRFSVRVTDLDVRVLPDRQRPGCLPSLNVRVAPLRRSFTMQARSRSRVTLRITLRRRAPDACRSAEFPLIYRAVAERA